MKISPPLRQGRLLKRYKRFLADIELSDGKQMTLHCPNTGSMKNCVVPSTPCWYSISDNPKRKLPGTLEITTTPSGHLAGVNTSRPNALVREAIENGVISELQGYQHLRTEAKYGKENSRIDLLLENGQGASREQCYIEVKNVTLEADADKGEDKEGLLLFPDAVTARGSKHLRELIDMVKDGHRAVLLFCVQHSGAKRVAPADDIDPVYGATLRDAINVGVEVLTYGCHLSAEEIRITSRLPFSCN